MPKEVTAFAVCAQVGSEVFYPEKNESTVEVKRLCEGCPIRVQCLHEALTHRERGVWGGWTERERRRLLKSGAHDPDVLVDRGVSYSRYDEAPADPDDEDEEEAA